ncbi:MAG: REP-associated tyrosine transposase [Terriglobales bacterium]
MATLRRRSYRRQLPHIHSDSKPLFVTFKTHRRWALPEHVRGLVLEACLRFHAIKLHMFVALVMPDHVHLIFQPIVDRVAHEILSLPEIMSGIKGASAHAINKALGRKGPVWQSEFFDHIIRASESLDEKIQYVRSNPVRAGLVERPKDYQWLWTDRKWE